MKPKVIIIRKDVVDHAATGSAFSKYRQHFRLSQVEVAAELTRLGHTISQSNLQKCEVGDNKIWDDPKFPALYQQAVDNLAGKMFTP